jgi:hypothetical protein
VFHSLAGLLVIDKVVMTQAEDPDPVERKRKVNELA